jgi:ligand-binding sensor protein
VIDAEGMPLTEISHPCPFCQAILQSLNGQAACRASWKECAQQSAAGSRNFTCHAGMQYITAPIMDSEKPIGYFLAGEFYWQNPGAQEEAERLQYLAAAYNVQVDTLAEAAKSIPVIGIEQHTRFETWPIAAARAVQSILHERTGFVDRLQKIAHLTNIQ